MCANPFACTASRSIVSFSLLYTSSPWPGTFNGMRYSPRLEVEYSCSTQGQFAKFYPLPKPAVENRGHPFDIQSQNDFI